MFGILITVFGLMITLSITITVTSMDNSPMMMIGMISTTFSLTIMFWTVKEFTPYLREGSVIKWLCKPIANIPEWVGWLGLVATTVLLAVGFIFLVGTPPISP